MRGRLAIATAGGEASNAADGVPYREAGRKPVPGRQRRHTVLADIPDRRHRRADQSTGENSTGLQCADN